MTNESELNIKITSTADTTGTEAQTAALEKLDLTSSKTANSIAVAFAKQEVAEKSLTSEMRAARQEAAQSALRQIDAQARLAKSGQNAAENLKHLGKSTKELSSLGREAAGVMEGLSRGGLDGLAQAGANAGRIFRTLTTGALGAPLLAAAAAAGVAFYALKQIVNEAQSDIRREFDKGTAAMKRQKDAYEANRIAAKASLDAQLKDVEKFNRAASDLDEAVNRANTRADKNDATAFANQDAATNLQEQQALGTAKTPEERDTITRHFAGVRTDQKNQRASFALEKEDSTAALAITNNQEKITDSQQLFRNAQSQVSEKEAALKLSQGAISGLPTGSDAQLDAIGKAKADEDALKTAQTNLAEVFAKMVETVKDAEAKIADATLTREDVVERRKGLAATTAADLTARANDATGRVGEAGEKVASIATQQQGNRDRIKGLSNEINASPDSPENDRLLAELKAAKDQAKATDAAAAEAQNALSTAQKEAAETKKVADAAILRATGEAQAAATAAAQKQMDASGAYHSQVVGAITAQAEQLNRQAKQIAVLIRNQKHTADAAQ